jgi:signal transduction histidine kinase
MREGGRIVMTSSIAGDAARVTVRDQGVGIPPELLERVFDRYYQVRSSEYRASGGLGIGLSIAKALVEMHDGSVQAQSDGVGKGAEFVVRLPIAEALRPEPQPHPHPHPHPLSPSPEIRRGGMKGEIRPQ